MKKGIVFLILVLCFSKAYAKIDRMIFFGDSLTDNGYLYDLSLHIIPKSPPYFEGRFSNGPTWAENLGNYYASKKSVTYKIYAVGGATAIYHPPNSKFVTLTTLEMELNRYLLNELFKKKDKTLFTIWIGANDYLFNDSKDINGETTKVVDKISWAIRKLKDNGARNFLILNLPDLSKTPQLSVFQNPLHMYTILHNQKLDLAILAIKIANPNLKITTIDTYEILNDVITDPEKYNKKYHIHIVDTIHACWKGGLTKKYNSYQFSREIQDEIEKHNSVHNVDSKLIGEYIESSPILTTTYQMGQLYLEGINPCANPDEYIFWDFLHPTAIVHNIFSKMIIEKIDHDV